MSIFHLNSLIFFSSVDRKDSQVSHRKWIWDICPTNGKYFSSIKISVFRCKLAYNSYHFNRLNHFKQCVQIIVQLISAMKDIHIFWVLDQPLFKRTNDQTNSKRRRRKNDLCVNQGQTQLCFPFGVTWPRHRPYILWPDQ